MQHETNYNHFTCIKSDLLATANLTFWQYYDIILSIRNSLLRSVNLTYIKFKGQALHKKV